METPPDLGAPSFDPRSWLGDGQRPAPSAPAIDRVSKPTPPPRSTAGRGLPIAAATTAVLLLAGAGISWLAHPTSLQSATPAGSQPASAIAIVAPPAPPSPDANRRTLVIAGPDRLAETLKAAGVDARAAQGAIAAIVPVIGNAAGQLHLVLDLVGSHPPFALTRMEATHEDGAGVIATAASADRYRVERLGTRLATRVKVVRGEMDATSFYNAAVTAGITDSLISDFADALAFDFDFQREIRPGDVFQAAFEQQVNPDGQDVGRPRLIYVAMTTPTKSRALYRFLAPGDKEAGWYDGNGHSSVRALLRTPLEGARITSQFGMRLHPVLGFMKMHKGTDFAAPVGTAIHAAGDATVEWAAMKGPNGNLTILRHDNGWETYYLHQNRFMPGVVAGARVHQGQQIGEVGTTGRSTGPHLHYEVHIGGQPVDPLGIDYGTGRTLTGGALAAFLKERNKTDTARAQAM